MSDIPGTTRDSIDSLCIMNGKKYLLIDTAGIRRKGKVSERIEKFSVIKALNSIEKCDIALILIDAHEGITEQDITIAGYAYEKGCGCIFLLNKWDLIEKRDTKTIRQYNDLLKDAAKFLSFAPSITVSALTGLRVSKVFNLVKEVYKQYSTRIGTGKINKIMEKALEKNEPPFHKGKRLKYYYTTQVAVKPPSFVCFVNFPDAVHFSYERYLINQIREAAELDKTPLRIFFRQRTGRIDFDKKTKFEGDHGHSSRSHAKHGNDGKENKHQRAQKSRKERKS